MRPSLYLFFPCVKKTKQNLQLNKHFHIWAGRFAYLAGVIQCYRGLELVATSDDLIFSAGDGLDLEVIFQGCM